jgi:hypothetical protein
MKRKKRWIQEYRCYKYGMNILKKIFFCKEPFEKCEGCPYLIKCRFETETGCTARACHNTNFKCNLRLGFK